MYIHCNICIYICIHIHISYKPLSDWDAPPSTAQFFIDFPIASTCAKKSRTSFAGDRRYLCIDTAWPISRGE